MQTDGALGREPARDRRRACLHARLELLEAGTPVVVERDDLAVEHHVGLRERIAERAQLREARRGVVAVPRA